MFQSLFGNLGHSIATSQQLTANQAQQYPAHYYAQQASQLQAMAQQQAQQGLGMSGSLQQGVYQMPRWMFNGVVLSILDFANEIWPEDCAEKTHFVLKYSTGE